MSRKSRRYDPPEPTREPFDSEELVDERVTVHHLTGELHDTLEALIILYAAQGNAQGRRITLQHAIEAALKNNINTRQSELEMRNAELNYRQARNNRLPIVQGSYDYGSNSGRSIDPFTNGVRREKVERRTGNFSQLSERN